MFVGSVALKNHGVVNSKIAVSDDVSFLFSAWVIRYFYKSKQKHDMYESKVEYIALCLLGSSGVGPPTFENSTNWSEVYFWTALS